MRLGMVLLLLALIIGGFSAFQTKKKLDSVDAAKSACYLKLQAPMGAGETIGNERAREAFIQECFVPDSRLSEIAVSDTPADRQWVAGRTAAVDIPSGILLLRQFFDRPNSSAFDETLIPTDRRAITLEVNELSSVGQFIRPGSYVDIIGVFERSVDRRIADQVLPVTESSARTILQAVEVLAAGRVTSNGSVSAYNAGGGSYRSVTLNVTPEQAELLVFAKTQSRTGLILSLRNQNDRGEKSIKSINFSDAIDK